MESSEGLISGQQKQNGRLRSSESDNINTGCAEYLLNNDFSHMASKMAHNAEEFVRTVWMRGWQVVGHHSLPLWLKDNDFLLKGHRPQLNTFKACFKSVFRVHTETGNIWTHLLGCGAFFAILVAHFLQPNSMLQWQDKLIITFFFIGAVLCMGFSCFFHTVYCHSETIGRLFNKLDYAGIAFMVVGSFIPFIYYSFYCTLWTKIFYSVLIVFLGTMAIVVAMFDKFASPQYRWLRAATFIALGLSALVPCAHYMALNGYESSVNDAAFGWLALMGLLYVFGAILYAVRIPERIFPGKFDLWFQSHQIFHVFVVIAAFVHYVGVQRLTVFRLTRGDCSANVMVLPGVDHTLVDSQPHMTLDANAYNDFDWITHVQRIVALTADEPR
ncbi:Adiponectin receptor protein 1 [Cichlidogyrus casuarinus]|uniref:Adiponectin receptor protein 1 n=1 Tax=Cichlidogyrus casuarinus TaxID=1844966 RepID=A0ABD2Q7U7_9PLAT